MSDNGTAGSNGHFSPELVHAYRKDFLYAWALLHQAPFPILMMLWNASSQAEEESIIADIKAGKYEWYSGIF